MARQANWGIACNQRDNKKFWDIYSDDILLQGMHGSYLADDA